MIIFLSWTGISDLAASLTVSDRAQRVISVSNVGCSRVIKVDSVTWKVIVMTLIESSPVPSTNCRSLLSILDWNQLLELPELISIETDCAVEYWFLTVTSNVTSSSKLSIITN